MSSMIEVGKKQISLEHIAQKLTEGYLCTLFLLLPLAIHNSYHDAPEVKAAVFFTLTALYLAALAVTLVIRYIRRETAKKIPFAKIDLAFVVFAAAGILSSLRSGYAEQAFFAADNRYQGILAFALYAVLFFAIKRYGQFTRRFRFFLLFSFSVVCLLGILNQMKLDPLRTLAPLSEFDRARFTSTLGNIGAYGAYCNLIFPAALCFFLQQQKRCKQGIYGIVALLGLFGTMAARTEGALIGLMTALFLMPFFCRGNLLRRYVYTLPCLIAAMQCYAVVVTLSDGYPLSGLMQALLSYRFSAIAFGLSLLLCFAIRAAKEETLRKIRRIYGIAFAVLVVAGILFVLAANLYPFNGLPASLTKYIVITPEWGTDRGRIWMSMAELYKSFPPVEKLIGGGIGCVSRWDYAHPLFPDANIGSAHNEYLHYLLTHGIVGLGSYLLFLGAAIRSGFRAGNIENRAYTLACIAYAAQAVINIARMFTTPLFLVLLFLLPAQSDEKEIQVSP